MTNPILPVTSLPPPLPKQRRPLDTERAILAAREALDALSRGSPDRRGPLLSPGTVPRSAHNPPSPPPPLSFGISLGIFLPATLPHPFRNHFAAIP